LAGANPCHCPNHPALTCSLHSRRPEGYSCSLSTHSLYSPPMRPISLEHRPRRAQNSNCGWRDAGDRYRIGGESGGVKARSRYRSRLEFCARRGRCSREIGRMGGLPAPTPSTIPPSLAPMVPSPRNAVPAPVSGPNYNTGRVGVNAGADVGQVGPLDVPNAGLTMYARIQLGCSPTRCEAVLETNG
jgi:hypothetical protein